MASHSRDPAAGLPTLAGTLDGMSSELGYTEACALTPVPAPSWPFFYCIEKEKKKRKGKSVYYGYGLAFVRILSLDL